MLNQNEGICKDTESLAYFNTSPFERLNYVVMPYLEMLSLKKGCTFEVAVQAIKAFLDFHQFQDA